MKIGLSNLRRLASLPPIDIRPITILVGRNSSGKSTFLRSFPLIRQSLMTRTSSPILWYGDLVDFGSFSTSINENAKKKEITFSFFLDDVDRRSTSRYFRPRLGHTIGIQKYYGVSYDVTIVGMEQRTRISRLLINLENPKVSYEISLDESQRAYSVRVNGNEMVNNMTGVELLISPGSLFPEINIKKPSVQSDEDDLYLFFNSTHLLLEPLETLLKPHLKKLSSSTFRDIILRVFEVGPIDDSQIDALQRTHSNRTWQKFVTELVNSPKSRNRERVLQSIALSALPDVVMSAMNALKGLFQQTLYIGPARARSERYYRYQDLAVSEIDPDGKNFPMFLNSLSKLQVRNLSNWIERLFGYGVNVNPVEGHISINIKEGGHETNIIDTGYGVSQILPVLAQIWWARERPNPFLGYHNEQGPILAIEQPELHLHPAHQALLADAIVGQAKPQNIVGPVHQQQLHFLIETHSETLINRLGKLIEDGRVDSKDVQIVIFDAEGDAGNTTVSISSFRPDGVLENWPYGFFQPKAS